MIVALLLLVLTADAFLWPMIPDDIGEHAIVAHAAGHFVWVAVMVTMAFWLCAAAWAQGLTDE
jgi:hypothetical protein